MTDIPKLRELLAIIETEDDRVIGYEEAKDALLDHGPALLSELEALWEVESAAREWVRVNNLDCLVAHDYGLEDALAALDKVRKEAGK